MDEVTRYLGRFHSNKPSKKPVTTNILSYLSEGTGQLGHEGKTWQASYHLLLLLIS